MQADTHSGAAVVSDEGLIVQNGATAANGTSKLANGGGASAVTEPPQPYAGSAKGSKISQITVATCAYCGHSGQSIVETTNEPSASQ